MKKINSCEFLFIIFVIITFLLIMFNKLKVTELTGILSLSCSMPEANQIKCSWSNCQLNSPEKTELIIAKTPNYVQTVEAIKSTDSVAVSVPSSGTYVITLSCLNGDELQFIAV